MKIFKNHLMTLTNISVLSILLFTQSASAGSTSIGTINFSIPGASSATAVPSLSGTMLIVLSLLLFIVAFRISKQKNNKNKEFFISLIGVFALSSSVGGLKIVSDARAGVTSVEALALSLDTATTGSAPITGPSTNYYDNSLGVPATITSINLLPNFSCNIPLTASKPADFSAPTCVVGNVIPNDQQCQLRCFSLLME